MQHKIMHAGGVALASLAIGCAAAPTDDGTLESAVSSAIHGRGDIDGDTLADIALTSGQGWNTMPTAYSRGDGTFEIHNVSVPSFPAWAQQGGSMRVSGDFNGDGRMDVALVGGAWWTSIPVAFSTTRDMFLVTNFTTGGQFPGWAAELGAHPISGDFDGDGRWDIALVGGWGWGSVPVAFSNGDGTFHTTNVQDGLSGWATQPGAVPVSGDFNGDGRTDIALVGGAGWTTIPVALSNGDGSFRTSDVSIGYFATWAAEPGAKPVSGDFDGNGLDDIALTGGTAWGTIPIAFSIGDGNFVADAKPAPTFATWAAQDGVRPVAGDFNGDGTGDIALVGGAGWNTIPVAFSKGDGTFAITNKPAPSFPGWATEPFALPVGAFTNGMPRAYVSDQRFEENTSTSLSGWFDLRLFTDGSYVFAGHIHDSGLFCYDETTVTAAYTKSGHAYTFERSGSVAGTLCSGSRDDDYRIVGWSSELAAEFPAPAGIGIATDWSLNANDGKAVWNGVRQQIVNAWGPITHETELVGSVY